MEIIRNTLNIENTGYFDRIPADTLFLDIETLGLSASFHSIYMIGTAVVHDTQADIVLYFAEHPDEEKEVIEAFYKDVTGASCILTYNGDKFDLPFIRKRAQKVGLEDKLQDKESIDLLKRGKKLKGLLGLLSCKQKDVEDFLGIDREDEMNGKELIPVYQRYVLHPNEKDRSLLISHNYCDVRGMLLLLPVLSYESLSSAEISDLKITIDPKERQVYAEAALSVSIPQQLRCHADDAYLIFSDHSVKCAFHLYDGFVRYYLDHPKDYVYLIEEDRILPKKLAGSVAKQAKRRAKPEECFSLADAGDPLAPPVEMYRNMLLHAIRNIGNG